VSGICHHGIRFRANPGILLRLRSFFRLFDDLCLKIKFLNQKFLGKIPNSIPRFSPPPTKIAMGGSLMGGRTRDALSGGVSGICHQYTRFRANPGILLRTKGHFGTFEPFLPKIDSMQKVKIDFNSHSSISKIMF